MDAWSNNECFVRSGWYEVHVARSYDPVGGRRHVHCGGGSVRYHVGLILTERAAFLGEELALSIAALTLRADSVDVTAISTVSWVARRLTDHADYDPGTGRSEWLRQGLASCDQHVSLTQDLLCRNDISSRSLALLGDGEVSRHTVLEVDEAAGFVVAPYFGWILRHPTGTLASFGDVRSNRFAITHLDPEDGLGRFPRAEYIRLFSPAHAPVVLGKRLSDVYSLKYKTLISWANITARMLPSFITTRIARQAGVTVS